MRRLFLILAVAGTFNLPAQDRNFKTQGYVNGRFWNIADADHKLVFVEAYREGMTTAIIAAQGGQPGHDYKEFIKIMQPLLPTSLVNGEVIQVLDDFYKDPLNRPIPIDNAFRVAAAKASGTDEATINSIIQKMRQGSVE